MQKVSEHKRKGNAPGESNRQWFRSIGLRVISAIIAIPIVLAAVWLGGWWAFAVASPVAMLGLYELYELLLHEGYRPVIVVSVALALLFLVAAMLPLQRLLLLEIGISGAFFLIFPLLFLRKDLDGSVIDWALTLVIALYLGWPMSFLLLLRGYSLGISPGFWWLITLFCGVWGFDSGAFFAGHFFGRHKLAPRISPGKTWEGIGGGMVFSILAAVIFTTFPLGVPWYLAVLLGVLIGVAATLGDLAESLIKRQLQVKDSGNFFPGHGGFLDRIDSLLFVALVMYIFAQLIGK